MNRAFNTDAAYYALAQTAVIVAFIAVWAAARKLVSATGALVAVLIIDGMHYFQYTAVKFNHDVIQLPFWGLAGYAFHAALRRGRIGHWLLLGFSFGAALWAKYFVVVLAVPYALFLLFDRDARRTLATPGPWLALAVALIVTAPHIVWLFQTDFLPLNYVEHRAEEYAAGTITFCILLCSPAARSPSCCRRVFIASGFVLAATHGRARFHCRSFRSANRNPARVRTGSRNDPADGDQRRNMWGYPLCEICRPLDRTRRAGACSIADRLIRIVPPGLQCSRFSLLSFAVNYTVLP